MPIVLAPLVELLPEYLRLCDGFVFTGGDDPRMEPFGEATHPKANPMDPMRQEFETALLASLLPATDDRSRRPVLGICLGMQMMALTAGGRLHQHLPDNIETADLHHPGTAAEPAVAGGMAKADRQHRLLIEPGSDDAWAELLQSPSEAEQGVVSSYHHQAVSDAGRFRVVARAPDGVIEAIANDPAATGSAEAWRLGVQWHPERTSDPRLGAGLFAALVREASRSMSVRHSP